MSSFLDKKRKVGDEHGKSGGSGWVTQIAVQFGFWVYVEGHDRLAFWKVCEDDKEADVIKAEVQARLDQHNISEEPDYCIRVFCDRNILGREPYEWDRNEFYARWQWDKGSDGIETCISLIINSMEKNSLPFEKKFWGRYQLKANPYHVSKGEAGKKPSKKDPKKKYFPTFALPVEKFANEQAAKEAVLSNSGGSSVSSKWSPMALKAYPEGNLPEEEILKFFEAAKKGIAFTGDAENFPLPTPANEMTCKRYIAEIYSIETSDIDQMIPF